MAEAFSELALRLKAAGWSRESGLLFTVLSESFSCVKAQGRARAGTNLGRQAAVEAQQGPGS